MRAPGKRWQSQKLQLPVDCVLACRHCFSSLYSRVGWLQVPVLRMLACRHNHRRFSLKWPSLSYTAQPWPDCIETMSEGHVASAALLRHKMAVQPTSMRCDEAPNQIMLGRQRLHSTQSAAAQSNHRSWADFYLDVVATDGNAQMLARMAVAYVFPMFMLAVCIIRSVILFKRGRKVDHEARPAPSPLSLKSPRYSCLLRVSCRARLLFYEARSQSMLPVFSSP